MNNATCLSLIGYVMSGLTAVVIAVAIFVVQGHMNGRYVFDDSSGVRVKFLAEHSGQGSVVKSTMRLALTGMEIGYVRCRL